jgi:hypothetical protein
MPQAPAPCKHSSCVPVLWRSPAYPADPAIELPAMNAFCVKTQFASKIKRRVEPCLQSEPRTEAPR